MISQNYEFKGKPTVEWHDGKNDDSGAEIINYMLTGNEFELQTTAGVIFKVLHHANREVLKKVESIFQR